MQVGNEQEGRNDSREDTKTIATKVLTCRGPFVTVKQVQSSISGCRRPLAATVLEVMANLKTDGLGTVLVVDRSNVFYKLLPFRATAEGLQNYDVTAEMYRQHFTARAPISCVSRELFNKMLDKSPDKEELETTYGITEEGDDD